MKRWEGLDGPARPDIWTFCGGPVVTVPAVAGPNSLPFGAQLFARKYDDYGLLAYAQMLRDEGLVDAGPFPALPARVGALVPSDSAG